MKSRVKPARSVTMHDQLQRTFDWQAVDEHMQDAGQKKDAPGSIM